MTLFIMQDTETDNVEITCEGRVILLKYNISVPPVFTYLSPPPRSTPLFPTSPTKYITYKSNLLSNAVNCFEIGRRTNSVVKY